MPNKPHRKSVNIIPGVIAGIIIAVIAFLLSFDALQQLFVSCGVNPKLSWGGPICVDGTILLTTWAVWGFKKNKIRGAAYPWVGFVTFSMVSILGNALHAYLLDGGTLPRWVSPAVMSIPPIALMYATHLIVIIAGDWNEKNENRVDRTVMETVPEPIHVAAPTVHETMTLVTRDDIPRQPVDEPKRPSMQWLQAELFAA